MEEPAAKALSMIVVHSTKPTHCHIQWQVATTVIADPRLGDVLSNDTFTEHLPTEPVRVLNICFTKENTLHRISNLFLSKELRNTSSFHECK